MLNILFSSILFAGGSEIQDECRQYVEQHGKLEVGEVYASTAGLLPCTKVIHVVGPKWQGGNHEEPKALYNATYECLSAAEEMGLTSVALPALSSGGLKFPVQQCTQIIVGAVKDFLEQRRQKRLHKVSLVHLSEDIVRAFHNNLGRWFGLDKVVAFDGDNAMTHQEEGK